MIDEKKKVILEPDQDEDENIELNDDFLDTDDEDSDSDDELTNILNKIDDDCNSLFKK